MQTKGRSAPMLPRNFNFAIQGYTKPAGLYSAVKL